MTGALLTGILGQGQRAAAVGLLLLLSGCIPFYIPPFGAINAERLGEIKVGSTTRPQVVDLLGEPNRLSHEKFSVYDLYSSKGWLGFVAGGYMGAGGAIVPLDTRFHRVLLEFDADGLVKRYEIEEAVSQIGNAVVPVPKGTKAEIMRFSRGVARSVDFSPDGRLLAGALANGQVLLWDAEASEEKMIIEGGGPLVRFSPDGKLVATFGNDMPTLWEVSSGAKKLSFEGHGSSGFFTSRDVHALAFSPDGKMVISGAEDGSIKVWEATTGKVLKTFEEPEGISSVAFSPDENILAATSKEVILWEADTGRELGRITIGSETGARAFSPDGRLLAVATRSHVEIWRLLFGCQRDQPANAESGRAMSEKKQEELVTVFLLPYVALSWEPVGLSVAFSPDGSKIAAGIDRAGAAWAVIGNLTNRRQIFGYYHYPLGRFPNDVALSPDGKTVALATGEGVYLFDVPDRPAAEPTSAADPSGKPEAVKK